MKWNLPEVNFIQKCMQVAEYSNKLKIIKMKTETKVPFVDEVEEFNSTFNKLNNYKPTIPDKADSDFVYNFIKEEVEELKEAYEKRI